MPAAAPHCHRRLLSSACQAPPAAAPPAAALDGRMLLLRLPSPRHRSGAANAAAPCSGPSSLFRRLRLRSWHRCVFRRPARCCAKLPAPSVALLKALQAGVQGRRRGRQWKIHTHCRRRWRREVRPRPQRAPYRRPEGMRIDRSALLLIRVLRRRNMNCPNLLRRRSRHWGDRRYTCADGCGCCCNSAAAAAAAAGSCAGGIGRRVCRAVTSSSMRCGGALTARGG